MPTATPDNTIVLTLYTNEVGYDSEILYQAEYDNDMSGFQTVFKGKPVPYDPSNPYSPIDDTSTFLDNNILNYMRNKANHSQQIKKLSKFNIEASIGIKTTDGTAQVRAIKLPDMMPYNARELFEPGAYDHLWKSYHYKESRGENSNNLYLDHIKAEMTEVWVLPPNANQCVNILFGPRQIGDINTGNNGGYLNLVNPNYKIGDITVSNRPCQKNKLRIIYLKTGYISYLVTRITDFKFKLHTVVFCPW